MDNLATIARAKAEREAAIINADAQKRAATTIAEGQKESEILRAESVASLYKMLVDLGGGAEVALQYEQIQALRNLSDSPNSKLVIVPVNMTALRDVRDVPSIESVIPHIDGRE
jgi:regulator of protease activity HflC (stomatin/prohibitin superfamily)